MATDANVDMQNRMLPKLGAEVRECLSPGSPLDALLLQSVDWGLAAAIFLVPLIMGGRIALGRLVLVALSLWIALCWCLRQGLAPRAAWVRSPAGPLLLAALTLVGLQLVPLPASILNVVSPELYETLPLWAPGADSSSALGVWTTLSLTPAATRDAFVLLLAFALLFLVTMQRVQRVEDVERLVRWIAISTVAMAAFALVHHSTTNGKYFWFFEYPFADSGGDLKGSFTNRNHFAQFIALGVGPLIWWIQDAVQSIGRRRRYGRFRSGENRFELDTVVALRSVAFALALFVGLLSLSRGGAVAIFLAALVSMLVLYRGSLITRGLVFSFLAIGLLVGACLWIHGHRSLLGRLDDFCSIEELDKGQMRRDIWQADSRGIADYPLFGTGLGSHCEACPMYLPSKGPLEALEVTHAENGYVQVGLETGVLGLLILVIAIGSCGHWCIACLRRPVSTRVILCFAAIAPSLAASCVHSLVDFVWYVPGCMVAVAVLAACACRLWQVTDRRRSEPPDLFRLPRAAWLIAAAGLIVVGYLMLQDRLAAARAEPSWYRYLLAGKNAAGIYERGSLQDLQFMEGQLSRVVDRQPDHARAHSRLAAVHLRLFDYPQDSTIDPIDVRQVRDAVMASHFESAEAVDEWLWRAFGPRCRHLHKALQHARRAVTLCPLQGEAYLYLADLSFLGEPDLPEKDACVEQALKVRPFDGTVLFAAGQEAVFAGNFDQALACWKASFRAGRVHQEHLLERLAGRMEVTFLLDALQLDLTALRRLVSVYRERNLTDELRLVQQRYAEASEDRARSLPRETAATTWMEAAGTYGELGKQPERLQCLRRAVRCHAADFDARYALGECLLKMKNFDEAEKHLRWCLREKPQDKRTRALAEILVGRRLRMTSRPTRKLETAPRVGL